MRKADPYSQAGGATLTGLHLGAPGRAVASGKRGSSMAAKTIDTWRGASFGTDWTTCAGSCFSRAPRGEPFVGYMEHVPRHSGTKHLTDRGYCTDRVLLLVEPRAGSKTNQRIVSPSRGIRRY